MKKFKELKDKQKLLAVFGILGLVLILTGVTYAFFSYTKEGSTENTLKSGSITFWYDEINQSGNSISIEDALPMSDEAGKQQTAAFNFKIQSTTSSTTTIPYEITLRQKAGTDNIGNIVKVYLAKTSAVDASIASEEEVELSLFSELSNVTKNTYSEKLLHTDLVPASDSPYTQFYRLKMWIDNNTDYSQVENETTHEMEYPYNNKTFTVTVNVYANGHVLDANSGTATVNSVSVGGTQLTSTETLNNIDYYESSLPKGTTSTTISINTGDYDQVTVTKTQSDYTTPVAVNDNIRRLSNTTNKKVSLNEGYNYFKITIKSEDYQSERIGRVKIYVGDPLLSKMILNSNESKYSSPVLTTYWVDTEPSGLYYKSVTSGYANGASGTTYYFRGNVTNNYVRFAEKDWRIVRINEDGTIRLILSTSIGNKNYSEMYYSASNMKTELETWYANNIGNNANYSNKVISGNYFCEGGYVGKESNTSRFTEVSRYTPTLSCRSDRNGHSYVNSSIGLITIDEAWYAGQYPTSNTVSNNYLKGATWTMSPAGIAGSNNWSYEWFLTDAGIIEAFQPIFVSGGITTRPVINLNADVIATGTGTSIDPYVIQ